MNDPKPLVVGIGWVVACAESKAHVPEQKYLISMEAENIAGTNKVCHDVAFTACALTAWTPAEKVIPSQEYHGVARAAVAVAADTA